jgi:hypothetical protein
MDEVSLANRGPQIPFGIRKRRSGIGILPVGVALEEIMELAVIGSPRVSTVILVPSSHHLQVTFREYRKFGTVVCGRTTGHILPFQILTSGPKFRSLF